MDNASLWIMGRQLRLLSFTGNEGVGQVWQFQMSAISKNEIVPEDVLGKWGQCIWSTPQAERFFSGEVIACHVVKALAFGESIFQIILSSCLNRLSRQAGSRFFKDASLMDILGCWQREHDLERIQIQCYSQNARKKHPFLPQLPQETDLDWLSRLSTKLGVLWFLQRLPEGEVLRLLDENDNLSLFTDVTNAYPYRASLEAMPAHLGGFFFAEHEFSQSDDIDSQHLGANDLNLTLGYCVVLTRHDKISELRVVNIEHQLTEYDPSHPGKHRYTNRLTLCSEKEPMIRYAQQLKHNIVSLPFQPGVVISNTDFVDLDEEGRYRLSFIQDRERDDVQKTFRFYRLQGYSDRRSLTGLPVGMHALLYHDSEVILGDCDGDAHNVWVMGPLPQETQPSPVTQANAEEAIWQTPGNTRLHFHHGQDRLSLSWTTPEKKAQIEFGQFTKGVEGVRLNSQGDFTLFSQQNLFCESQGDIDEMVATTKQVTVERDHLAEVQGDLIWETQGMLNVEVNGNFLHKGGASCFFKAEQGLFLSSSQQSWETMNGVMKIKQGPLILETERLLLQGENSGTLTLTQIDQGVGIRIHADGKIELFAHQISLESTEIQYQGQCWMDIGPAAIRGENFSKISVAVKEPKALPKMGESQHLQKYGQQFTEMVDIKRRFQHRNTSWFNARIVKKDGQSAAWHETSWNDENQETSQSITWQIQQDK